MEEQFGDMDREIVNEEDKWMLELRDAVELKRGVDTSFDFLLLSMMMMMMMMMTIY